MKIDVISPKWIGGHLSDNQWGIVLRGQDRVILQDFTIVGSSQIFKDHTITRPIKLCYHASWTHEGIQMMTRLWRLGHTDPNMGLRMRNVEISGFDKEKTWYPNCKTTEVSLEMDYLESTLYCITIRFVGSHLSILNVHRAANCLLL